MGWTLWHRFLKMKLPWTFTVLSFVVITILSANSVSGEKGKTRRFRPKVSATVSSFHSSNNTDTDPDPSYNNETSSFIYSSPIISSRSMQLPGADGGFDSPDVMGDDSFAPFKPDFNSWGSSSSPRVKSGNKYNPDNNPSLPYIAPRYNSDEKLEKFGQQSPVYSSYPIGSGLGGHNFYMNQNPGLDPYFEREKERAARDILTAAAAASRLNALNSHLGLGGVGVNPLVAAAAASSLFGNAVSPPGDIDHGDALLALGSQQGWGWGWKPASSAYAKWVKETFKHDLATFNKDEKDEGHSSKDNSSALSLIGLLGLLSLLANVLLLLTTTAAPARRKRSAETDYHSNDESFEAMRERVFYSVLPLLSPIMHARNGIIPTECALQGICLTNKIIVKEYGFGGRPLGNRMTSAAAKLLGEIDQGEDHKKTIETAGLHGRNQRNCRKIYPVCKAMQSYGPHLTPFIIKMEDVPRLMEKLRKTTGYLPKL